MSAINRVLGPMIKRVVAQAASSEEVHDSLRSFVRRCAVSRPTEINNLTNKCNPYFDSANKVQGPMRDDIVFITSRFRSGSTALWNAFRQLPHMTAYYEPFNERRFFDPSMRGTRIDETHIGVNNYWSEYDAVTGLTQIYDENWIREGLFMGEHAWNPRMKRFIDGLIEQAPGRPVLQFNRVDFRLPWLRRQYPNAAIVHLYRNPREQWRSFLPDLAEFPSNAHPSQFNDHFYLQIWARDLQHVIPLLGHEQIEHPYELFYLIWKLSYLFGQSYATHSIAYEQLTNDPNNTIADIVKKLNMQNTDIDKMVSVISAPRRARWTDYAAPRWFEHYEHRCEELLDSFLGNDKEGCLAQMSSNSRFLT